MLGVSNSFKDPGEMPMNTMNGLVSYWGGGGIHHAPGLPVGSGQITEMLHVSLQPTKTEFHVSQAHTHEPDMLCGGTSPQLSPCTYVLVAFSRGN